LSVIAARRSDVVVTQQAETLAAPRNFFGQPQPNPIIFNRDQDGV
jgi:hypothetical protein